MTRYTAPSFLIRQAGLAFFAAASLLAQAPAKEFPSAPHLTSLLPPWIHFLSAGGAYTVDMPASPQTGQTVMHDTLSFLSAYSAVYKKDGEEMMVLEAAVASAADRQTFLNGARGMFSPEGAISSEVGFQVGPYRATHLLGTAKGIRMDVIAFVTGSHGYMLLYRAGSELTRMLDEPLFLTSFRFDDGAQVCNLSMPPSAEGVAGFCVRR